MAFNINFKNTESLLRQMIPYLMQYKLGEASNQRTLDRQMQVDAEQERLLRERMAEAESIAHRGRKEAHDYATEEELTKFEQIVKKLPYVNQLFMAQQENPTPETTDKLKEVGVLYDTAYDNIQQGNPVPSGVMSKLLTIDPRSEIINNMMSTFTSRAGSITTARTAEAQLKQREKEWPTKKARMDRPSGSKEKDPSAWMYTEINNLRSYVEDVATNSTEEENYYNPLLVELSTMAIDARKGKYSDPMAQETAIQRLLSIRKNPDEAMKQIAAPTTGQTTAPTGTSPCVWNPVKRTSFKKVGNQWILCVNGQ